MERPVQYLLFTYPNCPKCDALKAYLQGTPLEGEECSLTRKEGKLKIRDYLKALKRDDKGGILIPTLIVREAEEVLAILNDREELEDWLRSRG
jgi:glutaredoxin